MKTKVLIKPLSSNQAWRGRRFKSVAYMQYEKELNYLLPKHLEIPEGKLQVHYIFGFSSKGSDYDNAIKSFQDFLQKRFQFNDNKIYRAFIEKVDVKKGKEFIEFSIEKYEEF